ncbi:amidase [Gracilimonas sp. BCB1]|uniref:amidase n=1 Tax=Gracilimonas sp. BCB1 TaxID=3152362 RepID=UPI0032D91BFD
MKTALFFWAITLVTTVSVSCQPLSLKKEDAKNSSSFSKEFDVVEATIDKVHQAYTENTLSAERLVEIYLERIRKYDQPSGLNAITSINQMALQEARNLDEEFRKTGVLRPLHGIPVIVKENISTTGLQTTAGSLAMQGFMPKEDAFIIKKLKDAGAIILAKSNMAEWGINANVTISSVAGETLNPYNLAYTTAGSSGGTAAAIAANFGIIGIGTDTGGSIRGPASHNAIVGVRPSMGLTSRKGIIPLNLRNDVPGPMTRTAEDAARVLEVINGYDPEDPLTEYGREKLPGSYTELLQKDVLKGVRIGVFRKLSNYASPEIDALFQQAIYELEKQGAIIVESFEVPGFDSLRHNQWCAVFQDDLNEFLSSLGDEAPVNSLQEVIASGKYSKYIENDLINYQKYMWVQGETVCGGPFSDTKRIEFRNAIQQAMNLQRVDALIYPSWNRAPIKAGTLYAITGDNNHVIAPHTGQPAVTIPMGFLPENLPAGIQFLGRIFEDHKILSYAYAFERATRHRKKPKTFSK